jgi:hypothetical protein
LQTWQKGELNSANENSPLKVLSNDRDYIKKAVTKPSLKMALRQLSAYWVELKNKA